MAVDQALLEAMPRLVKPVLRFYSWTEPAASFGYFQRFAQIEKLTHLRPLVRRPTAGGLVPHAADWTYSLAFPNSDDWYLLAAVESYQRIHQWLRASFALLKVETELAQNTLRPEAGQCFIGYERFDLLWQGKKIAGAAQRRTREGLLIQGSIQPPTLSLCRSDWEQAMCKAAASADKVEWATFEPSTVVQRARELEAQRYTLASYTRKR
jgi:lipoate-protein ligase A